MVAWASMDNIAVVLAVPSYESLTDLPGCSADRDSIVAILRESGKFGHLLVVDEKLSHAEVKTKVADFFRKQQAASIGEVFVYFSGHGGVIDGDFHFALRDFDDQRPKTTSISNSELDQWARSVSPSVFCKIVDACHSGVAYIKDGESIVPILDKSKSEFNKVYFFYSSRSDQKSYATEHLSRFTEAVVRSVQEFEAPSITYNDLARSVADMFLAEPNQKPYFVTQADLTEKFVDIPNALREQLRLLVEPHDQAKADKPVRTALIPSLKAAVEADAKEYLDKDKTLGFLDELRDDLAEAKFDEELDELYRLTCDRAYNVTVGERTIAKWLSDRLAKKFFVDLSFSYYYTDWAGNRLDDGEVARIRQSAGIMRGVTAAMYNRRTVLDGYVLSESARWEVLNLTAEPLYPNLPMYRLQVTYAIAPKELVVFGAVVEMLRTGWESFHPSDKIEWIIETFRKAELEEKKISAVLIEKLKEHVRSTLVARFQTKEEPERPSN